MSGLFTSIRFVMALLTVLAIAAKPFIPPKTLLIHPREDVKTGIFGPVIDGRETVSALNEQQTSWRCDYPERFSDLSCGLAVYWNPPRSAAESTPLNFIDASQYDGFRIQVVYEGRADFLRVYLSNDNPDHQKIRPGLAEKHLAAFLNTDDLRSGPTFVSLKNFTVGEWWIINQNPPRFITGPEFGHLVRMGIDSIDPGIHRVRLERIELVGERIANETYLLLILAFWVAYLLLEACLRYYRLKQAAHHQRAQLEDLSGGTDQLTKENLELQSRSITDPLTGIHNRHGFSQQVQQLYGHDFLPVGTGLIVMDIDHFKAINDRWGHPVGDVILEEFAALIAGEVRAGDIFARWGGEEFVLLVDGNPAAALQRLAEKLRQRVADHPFPVEPPCQVTVSMGVAWTVAVEPFDTLFKRADLALYQAKKTRNCVQCAFTDQPA
jgi:diguanylate cyclase (GGDEF)-like protein